MRRSRRSVNLDDSEDSEAECVFSSSTSSGPPESLPSAAGSSSQRRRSARLAARTSPAVSTPQRAQDTKRLRADNPSPYRTPTAACASGSRAASCSPASILSPASRCPSNRGRGSGSPSPAGDGPLNLLSAQDKAQEAGASGPAEATDGSSAAATVNPRHRRLWLARRRSESPFGHPSPSKTLHKQNHNPPSSSSSSSTGGLDAPEQSSSGGEKPETPAALSRSTSLSPLPAACRRLRKRQMRGTEDEHQGANPHAENEATKAPTAPRPSPKDVQQRLQQLAKQVKEKTLRARGLQAAADSGGSSDSEIHQDADEGLAVRRRLPRSARMASKVCRGFCCLDRHRRLALSGALLLRCLLKMRQSTGSLW